MAGDRESARHELSRARTMLTQLQMDLHATLANRELGTLLGGGEGDQYVAESDAWLRAQGVVNPERFAAAF